MQKYGAEFLGTFWLVLGGCGSAVISAAFPDVGIGLLGVSLAFGLTVLTMAFAIGHISGCQSGSFCRALGWWSFSSKSTLPVYFCAGLWRRCRRWRPLSHCQWPSRL